MAQKKTVSVSSVASKSKKVVKTTASTRAKPAAAKKAAVKKAAPKKATPTKAGAKTVAEKVVAKPAAKKTTAAKKPAVTKVAAAKSVAPKKTASRVKTTAAAKAKPAAKAAASTKSKIAAVAARRAAAAKAAVKPAARPLKAVAAAAPAAAKRSSVPVAPTKIEAPKKPAGVAHGFVLNEYIVYPAHGVGQIVGIEEQEIAGLTLELFVITFDKDKMTLRVPTAKVDAMRKLASSTVVEKAMNTLKGRARVKRTMWSRRAQEYENKINSGDLIFIAEVVRDLYRSESQPEQSYSERQLYEAALDRMARELAAVEKIDERGAVQRITDLLCKSAKGRRQAEEEKAEAAAAAEEAEAGKDDGAAAA